MSAAREEIVASAGPDDVIRQLRDDEHAEIIEQIISHGLSLREARWRGDTWLVGYHWAQAREEMRKGFAVFRLLEPSMAVAAFDRNRDGKSSEAGDAATPQKGGRSSNGP